MGIREGLRYYCDQCKYVATESNSLKRHTGSVHAAIIYLCEQCDYEANDVKTLRVTNESRHEGIKYPCDQCKHVALSKRSHKFHKECWLQQSLP